MHALSVATLVVLCGTACAFVHPGGTLPRRGPFFSTPSAEDASPTAAEDIAPRWKVLLLKDDVSAARYSLQPVSVEWDTTILTVEIDRTAESPGLGIMLEEYGRDDNGCGLTLITGLVPGGNAEKAAVALLPGDAIIRAGDESVECLNYDNTVDGLGALPAAPAPAVLKIKRLIPRAVVTMIVRYPPEEDKPVTKIRLLPGRQIRNVLMANGFDMPSCSEDVQCKKDCCVQIRRGWDLLEPMQTQEKQMLKREPRWRLSCRCNVRRDLEESGEIEIRIRPDLENIMRRSEPPGARRR